MADLLAYGEDIIGFPGGEATAKVKLMKLLWENPSPTESFAPQDITLDLSEYTGDLIYMVFKNYTTSDILIFALGKVGQQIFVSYPVTTSTSGGLTARGRVATIASNKITFGDAYEQKANGSEAVNNNRVIPYQIYGIKLEQEIPVVAENVSTLAANCLLSDGETSVEDRIGNILFVEKSISNKSISTAWGSTFIAYETVDISSLGLSNAPDVVSATFSTTDARIALCCASNINRNSISIALIRAESGTVSGKIIITLKSNG